VEVHKPQPLDTPWTGPRQHNLPPNGERQLQLEARDSYNSRFCVRPQRAMIDSRSSSRCTSDFTAMIDHTDQFFTELNLRLPIAR
jgi:hypothetical protein